MSVIQGCVRAGARRIIGVDIDDKKEAFARQMGMTEFVNPKVSDALSGFLFEFNVLLSESL